VTTAPLEQFRRALVGATCKALVGQAYGYHGRLVDPIQVVYLQFGHERWARFGIDGGDFHWRETTGPEPIEADGSGHAYVLFEVDGAGVVDGRRIERVAFTFEPPDGGRLTIELAGGAVLVMVNADDYTRVEIAGSRGQSR